MGLRLYRVPCVRKVATERILVVINTELLLC
jgi:hypothetical protein